MQTIEKSTDDISSIAARMLKTFQESVPERIQEDIPKEMMNLQDKVNNSAKAVLSIANLFDKAAEYLDASSSNIGRKGFMLVGEVKNFWLAMAAFVGEIEKMIEYSLDSSCVPMFKIMEAQVNEVSNNKAYSMKSKIRQQIYQSTLSVVGFALAVRQLANAYIDFSSKFIIPQINILAGYVLVSNSENELKCERRKFRACNLACRKDVDETVQNNRLMGKRRSILELDLGLNVHLSDVSEALEDALLAIIAFKSNGEIKKLRKPRDLEEESPKGVLNRLTEKLSKISAK
ncbi:hypothetical protein AB6A40_009342 [Gnathostoma spinigerum]|uniref:Uncharacterized protein n=1 Tax=Gnathostoma spinigerum TaxID=75299 RepID=A0ABD6EZP9_9BILA